MELTLQNLIFIFIGTATRYCVNGIDVGCICADSRDAFITNIRTEEMAMCGGDESDQNQILDRLDSMIDIIQQHSTLITSLPKDIALQNTPSAELQKEPTHKKNSTQDKASKEDESSEDPSSSENNTNKILKSCEDALADSEVSGTYTIRNYAYGSKPFKVSCDADLFGGDWTVVMRRKDGSVDFFRELSDYKKGFGDLEGEFFIGLDKLYALTNGEDEQELIFVMDDYDDVRKYAKYSSFAIGNEEENYVLKTLGDFYGDAGDSFTYHKNMTFKTKDIEDEHNCANKYVGAWWYNNCYDSNLFGKYKKGNSKKGVVWYSWHGEGYSLKFVQMMIRTV